MSEDKNKEVHDNLKNSIVEEECKGATCCNTNEHVSIKSYKEILKGRFITGAIAFILGLVIAYIIPNCSYKHEDEINNLNKKIEILNESLK